MVVIGLTWGRGGLWIWNHREGGFRSQGKRIRKEKFERRDKQDQL